MSTGPLILVTGGTGTLGSHVVARLRDADRATRVLSRGGHPSDKGVEYVVGDLSSGVGVEAAVDGAETVVHCAGGRKGDDDATRNLVQAASRAGVRHLVYISVVGADRVPMVSGIDRAMFGYFGNKHATERVVAERGLPSTTLRATQFHDLILTIARQMARLPVLPVPSGMRFQPIDAGEVAERLVELAQGAPAGLVPDLAGPQHPRRGRAAARLPAGARHGAHDGAGLDTGRGRQGAARRREPGCRTGPWAPHLGGVPARPRNRPPRLPAAKRAPKPTCRRRRQGRRRDR